MASTALLRRLGPAAAIAMGLGILTGACADGTPPTGAEIEVVNGVGVSVPQYLLFDWADSERVLVRDRRAPESALLDPAATPLATLRIAVTTVGNPERRVTIRGMIGDERISLGAGTVQLVEGSWQKTSVVLAPDPGGVVPDGGTPPPPTDGPQSDGGVEPADAAARDGEPIRPVDADPAGPDVAPPPADTNTTPPDAEAPADLPRPDAPRDLPVDTAPLPPLVVLASADSYVEQGDTSATKNYGTAAILEVKSQNGEDNNRIAYLRFTPSTLAGITASSTVTLRLYGRSGGGTNAESAYGVSDEAWTETGINWNNRPMVGAKLATVPVTTTSQYREWNVSGFARAQFLAGRPSVSFAVSMDGDTGSSPDVHQSREASANQPQLVITR